MTSRRPRRSNLREFKDRDDEYRETSDPDAGIRRFDAMRKLSPEDYRRASETMIGRLVDERDRKRDLLREMNFRGFRKKG